MGRIPFASLLPLAANAKGEHVLEVPELLGGPRQFNFRRLLGPCAGPSVRWPSFLGARCGGDCSRLAAATARRAL